MATDVLPATLSPDRAAADRSALALPLKPSLLRRVFNAIVTAQTRRAEREIAHHMRALGLRRPDDA